MKERWCTLWRSIASSPPEPEFDELVAAYSQPHRAYHDLDHIRDCLDQLDQAGESPERPSEVEIALWFHDVVYRTRSRRNEQRSAECAERALERGDCAEESIALVRDLILATRHAGPPPAGDAALVVDIDLSILGRPPEEFAEYEEKIRREYAWLPGPIYRRKRAAVLQRFLERDSIYATPSFRERFEDRARANLEQSLGTLHGARRSR